MSQQHRKNTKRKRRKAYQERVKERRREAAKGKN